MRLRLAPTCTRCKAAPAEWLFDNVQLCHDCYRTEQSETTSQYARRYGAALDRIDR